jgi:hypothetical protein
VATPRLVEGVSKDALVNYYRCPNCHHVWTIDKTDSTKITHVTPLPTDQKKPS